MLFSHKVQTISIVSFCFSLFLLTIYEVLIIRGVLLPECLQRTILLVLGFVAFVSALVAPFSKEIIENDTVQGIRLKLLGRVCSIVFFCLLLSGFVAFFLKVMDATVPDFLSKQFSLRLILFIEIVYFVALKLSISHYLKK